LIDKWLVIHSNSTSLKPEYYIKSDAKILGREIFDKLNIDKSKKIIALNASAKHNFLWPKDNFVALCNALLKDNNIELIFLGTSDFIPFYNQINERLPADIKSLAGKTSLDELAEVLKEIDLLITVDTGMRHLANALNVHVIDLLHGASNSMQDYAKYVDTEVVLFNKVPCSPCGMNTCYLGTIECMTGIKPETVLSQAMNYLSINNCGEL
jgi:ADP-heptose:LPS heptosyltransferase